MIKWRKKFIIPILYLAVALIFCIIWLSLIAPEFKKLPNHFSYSADILSIDNFYDEKAKKFEGGHISKTVFSYETISSNPDYLMIRNAFEVSKLSDKPIFSVSRLYYVNPYSTTHVKVPGKEQRVGYLFAPQYLHKQPFYYWHVNYNAPAWMKFVDKEIIDGLTVYHYQAFYTADQTAELHRLPGVPENLSVKAEVNLQLWIEPISGWLVKYQDNTLAYYYDKKTGQKLIPWNVFSNRYTQNSIHQKVQEAFRLKWYFLLLDFGVPLTILIITAAIIFNSSLKKYYKYGSKRISFFYKRNSKLILLVIAYSMFAVMLVGTIYYFISKDQPKIFKIGISQWNNNVEILAAVKGFKDGLAESGFYEGKNLQFITENPQSNIEKQIEIIQGFVHEKVDLIFVLTTPGVLVAKGITTTVPIVYSDVSYPVESGINSPQSATNLVGTLNYISPAKQFYYFDTLYPATKILGFVRHKGDPDSEIQFKEYKEMLSKRNIDIIDIPVIDYEDMQELLSIKFKEQRFDALFLACDALMREESINKVAATFTSRNKIPSFTCNKDRVLQGLLVGYFADLYTIGKLAGIKAAFILRGAKPAWINTEAPQQGYLMINTKTAKILGITIPEKELKKADEIIK